MTPIHYARYDWVRTACNKRVVSGLMVCTRKESATCPVCRDSSD